MSLGRLLLFTAVAAVGAAAGYAAARSDTARAATKATIKAGVKATEWTKEQCAKATNKVKAIAREAKDESVKAEPAKAG